MEIIQTSSLSEDDKRLYNPFVDISSISKVFPIPSLGSMGFVDPILHNGVSPESKLKQAHISISVLL